MSARENEIGPCRCPLCGSTRARLRVSGKQLAYVVCNSCNAQLFARSERSDELARALHVAEPAPAAAPDDAPPPPPSAPAPAAPSTTDDKPAMGWGVLGWLKN